VLAKEAELSQWIGDIQRIRREFFYINYLNIKSCNLLILKITAFMEGNPSTGGEELFRAVREVVGLVNVEATKDGGFIADIALDILSTWKGLQGADGDKDGGGLSSAVDKLRRLATALERALSRVPVRTRSIAAAETDKETDKDTEVYMGKINTGKDMAE
jgi:hypothetical protein